MKNEDLVHEFDEPGAIEINKARLNHLDSLGLEIEGKRLIDVGAGIGNLARFFVEKKCDVVCVEGRSENVDVLRKRLPVVESYVLDVNKESLKKFGDFEIVFSYGLLYHTSKPSFALNNLALICNELLILETCICDSRYPQVRFVHDPSTRNQALDGIGCRPSPGFVVETLKLAGLRNIYIPRTPPKHKDFNFVYENDRSIYRDGNLMRQIFLASRSPLVNSNLKEVSSGEDFYTNTLFSKLPSFVLKLLVNKTYKSGGLIPVKQWVLDVAGEPKPGREIYKNLWNESILREHEKALIKWNGINLNLSFNTETAYSIYVNGEYEPNETSFLKSILKNGMTFIDIGANVGIYSLIAAKKVGEKGRVIAVEPSSREYDQLAENIKINRLKKITLVKNAISDKVGHSNLEIASLPHSGHNTLKNFLYSTTKKVKNEKVVLETLDIMVDRLALDRVDVIKIDVEGMEYEVIKEGLRTYDKFGPLLIFELSNQSIQNGDFKKILDLLKSKNYKFFTFSIEGLKSINSQNFNGGNVIAMQPMSKQTINFNLVKFYPEGTYIDHSFHQKTKSTSFTIDLLKDYFDLKVVFDNSWKKNNNPKINFKKIPRNLFYMQILPNLSDLKLLSKKSSIVWFPMYDAVATSMRAEYLKELSKVRMKVICFSKVLYDTLKSFDFNCRYFQYYPNPSDLGGFTFDYEERNVYFWYRKDPINWDLVKKLMENTRVDKIIIKNDPDPGSKPLSISQQDIERYRVKIVQGHLEGPEYSKLLTQANIFIAPRVIEGIGQSVVESLMRGQCVIAPNEPTMNEYIKHDSNGILYDPKKPEGLDLSNYDEIGMRARMEAISGYKKWNKDKRKFLSFINND